MPRFAYVAPHAASSVGPYSHAVDAGELIYLSGQTPVDPETGRLVKGGIGEQTARCLDSLFAVLAAAGLGPDDVVKATVYLRDMSDYGAMNEVYARKFAAPYPARSTIGVQALPLGAAVEIELIARKPGA